MGNLSEVHMRAHSPEIWRRSHVVKALDCHGRTQWMALVLSVCLFTACRAEAPATNAIQDLNGTIQHPMDPGENRANVLFFIRTDCPISNAYAPEISRLAKQYGSEKIGFYVVYAMRDLSVAAAREHLKQYGLTVPAIIDRKHDLVKA